MVDYEKFFFPKSIAIIGASTKMFKFGSLFLKALIDFKYPGKLYPVNPRGEKILGLDSWELEDINAPIDLCYITVPAPKVPNEIKKCAAKGIDSVIILTAGFKEAREEGKKLEDNCIELSKKHNISIIGPNCFGVYCPKGDITLLPGGDFPKESGNIAMLSQSGGNSVNFVILGTSYGMRFSKVISYGNACDLDLPDFLEYLNEDNDTKYIVSYVEGVKDIGRLKKVVENLQKPLIIWKSGLTEDGARAATSHTGFLSGQKEIWAAFFKQFNILNVNSFEELLDATNIISKLPELNTKKMDYRKLIGVTGGGGGIGIEISDFANRYDLKIPKLNQMTIGELEKLLPSEGTSINNPLDIGNPFYMIADHKKFFEIFINDPSVSILMVDIILDFVLEINRIYRVIKKLKNETNIPILIILRTLHRTSGDINLEKKYRKIKEKFQDSNIPVFPSFHRGIRALSNYIRYYEKNRN
jgi:acyl-CoA synthetase (NDP forming)